MVSSLAAWVNPGEDEYIGLTVGLGVLSLAGIAGVIVGKVQRSNYAEEWNDWADTFGALDSPQPGEWTIAPIIDEHTQGLAFAISF